MGLILFLKHGEGHTQLIFSNFEVSFFEVIEIEPQQYDEKLVEAKQIRILTILSDFTIKSGDFAKQTGGFDHPNMRSFMD
jgi:hypothetical protein